MTFLGWLLALNGWICAHQVWNWIMGVRKYTRWANAVWAELTVNIVQWGLIYECQMLRWEVAVFKLNILQQNECLIAWSPLMLAKFPSTLRSLSPTLLRFSLYVPFRSPFPFANSPSHSLISSSIPTFNSSLLPECTKTKTIRPVNVIAADVKSTRWRLWIPAYQNAILNHLYI